MIPSIHPRSKSCRFLLVLAACLGTTQCTSFHSYYPAEGKELSTNTSSRQGLHYFLPRSQFLIVGKYIVPKADEAGAVKRYEVSLTKVNASDPAAQFFAEIDENSFYDENSKLKTVDGLLTTVDAQPEDKTADIVKSLASTALGVMQLLPSLPAVKGGAAPPPPGTEVKPKPTVKNFSKRFDPLDQAERERVLKEIENEAGVKVTLTPKKNFPSGYWPRTNEKTSKAVFGGERGAATVVKSGDRRVDGLAYRRPLPVHTEIQAVLPYEDDTKASSLPMKSDMTIPNPGSVAVFPVKRGFMTKRHTVVAFTAGEPTDVQLSAPSPVLGFVKLPEELVKMVGQAVPSIINIRNSTPVSQTKAQNDLLQMQINQLKLENELRQLQQARGTGQ